MKDPMTASIQIEKYLEKESALSIHGLATYMNDLVPFFPKNQRGDGSTANKQEKKDAEEKTQFVLPVALYIVL